MANAPRRSRTTTASVLASSAPRELAISSKPPLCFKHGSVHVTKTPEKVRKRVDRLWGHSTAEDKTGQPCRNYALQGTTVCVMHGGSIPDRRSRLDGSHTLTGSVIALPRRASSRPLSARVS